MLDLLRNGNGFVGRGDRSLEATCCDNCDRDHAENGGDGQEYEVHLEGEAGGDQGATENRTGYGADSPGAGCPADAGAADMDGVELDGEGVDDGQDADHRGSGGEQEDVENDRVGLDG